MALEIIPAVGVLALLGPGQVLIICFCFCFSTPSPSLMQTSRLVDELLGEVQGLRSQVTTIDGSVGEMGDKVHRARRLAVLKV